MNCELIFYLASKTNICEKALATSIADTELNLSASLFATSPQALGGLIIDAYDKTNVVFIIGGLMTGEKSSVENVLSKALANKTPDDIKKLKNPASDSDGYLIRQGGQLLIVLPDEPEEIAAIMRGPVGKYLSDFTGF